MLQFAAYSDATYNASVIVEMKGENDQLVKTYVSSADSANTYRNKNNMRSHH